MEEIRRHIPADRVQTGFCPPQPLSMAVENLAVSQTGASQCLAQAA